MSPMMQDPYDVIVQRNKAELQAKMKELKELKVTMEKVKQPPKKMAKVVPAADHIQSRASSRNVVKRRYHDDSDHDSADDFLPETGKKGLVVQKPRKAGQKLPEVGQKPSEVHLEPKLERNGRALEKPEPKPAGTEAVGPKAAELKPAGTEAVGPKAAEPKPAGTEAVGPKAAEPKPSEASFKPTKGYRKVIGLQLLKRNPKAARRCYTADGYRWKLRTETKGVRGMLHWRCSGDKCKAALNTYFEFFNPVDQSYRILETREVEHSHEMPFPHFSITFGLARCTINNNCELCPLVTPHYVWPNSDPIQIDGVVDCQVTNTIYVVICCECDLAYVGQTSLKLAGRISCHRSEVGEVQSAIKTGQPLRSDLRPCGPARHSVDCRGMAAFNVSVSVLEVLKPQEGESAEDFQTRMDAREAFFITSLNTLFPAGLNRQLDEEYIEGPISSRNVLENMVISLKSHAQTTQVCLQKVLVAYDHRGRVVQNLKERQKSSVIMAGIPELTTAAELRCYLESRWAPVLQADILHRGPRSTGMAVVVFGSSSLAQDVASCPTLAIAEHPLTAWQLPLPTDATEPSPGELFGLEIYTVCGVFSATKFDRTFNALKITVES